MMRSYPAILHLAEGQAFWIELPDFPEATTRGLLGVDDPEKEAVKLLEAAIQFRKHDGLLIPMPSHIDKSRMALEDRYIYIPIDVDAVPAVEGFEYVVVGDVSAVEEGADGARVGAHPDAAHRRRSASGKKRGFRILFADDHVMVRDALRPTLLELSPSAAIFEAGTFPEVIDLLKVESDFDVAILDLRIPGMDAIQGIRTIREHYPNLLVVVLSSVTDRKLILETLSLGIAGFIPKRLSAQALLSALRLIIAGERYVPASLFDDLAQSGFMAPATPAGQENDNGDRMLTLREREILDLLREGLPNKLIARRLNVSEVTVKSHLCHVFRKLGVQNRVQAARLMNDTGRGQK